MFISPWSGTMTLERLIWLKYNIVLKLQINYIQFRLLPEVRITSKKASNESCSKLNFVQKSLREVKDQFFDFTMIDQSKLNFKKS